ncbi:hypothetical protein B14911_25895 [Bacillus sp. NRRL B-14911]|nr:hypothetical protein B14911_25895 [Bacillus sp. NRRL B-14911]
MIQLAAEKGIKLLLILTAILSLFIWLIPLNAGFKNFLVIGRYC